MSNINNCYLYNQTTGEKSKRNIQKNDEFTPNRNYIYDYKRINYLQSFISESKNQNNLYNNFTKKKNDIKSYERSEINKIKNSQQKKKNYVYSSLNLNNIPLKYEPKPYQGKNEIVNKNNEIQPYSHYNKKSKYQRSNSIAYIKKRPNDLIKIQSLDNNVSLISHKYLRNSFKMKGHCLSFTNMKNNLNIINNDIEGNDIQNNSSKRLFSPISYPFAQKNKNIEKTVNKFSIKNQNKIFNKNIFVNSIFNVIKKNLFSKKLFFFKNIKTAKKDMMYEVSFEEYKFIVELKALGVTNKKELNSLLKEIFASIKGNYGINTDKK